MSAGSGLRATAALAVGAFALHQLRYLLGYGEASSETLAAHGHSYLAFLTPLVALLAALAGGQFLAALARAGGGPGACGGTGPRLRRLWPAATATLLATYVVQELLEGLLAPGHPAGLPGIVGGGGWWALPLAAAIGLLVALALRGADAAIEVVAARRRPRAARVAAGPARHRAPHRVDLPGLPLLALKRAGRAPPPSIV